TETGWTVGAPDDDATTGIWERADPQGTEAQPEDDHTDSGTDCYVTGALAGQGLGSHDVDDGKTTLYTPLLNAMSLELPIFRYYKWYTNNTGDSPNQDYWVVDISNDAGQTWINVENTLYSTVGWTKVQFLISDYIEPTAAMLLRFVASDYEPGSLVEAAIDDLEILGLPPNVIVDKPNTTELPQYFALSQNYPNPCFLNRSRGNPLTTIGYALPTAAHVNLTIYNTAGQEVRRLVNLDQGPGFYNIQWDGNNRNGARVASGVYFYRLVADHASSAAGPEFNHKKTMVLLK
ncbi:MAG: T9SS type A sorting domain-containing protein, partial [Planctomycetes bacterium]|nr:T9SS type A sorting domain-containing protein [Planctomycetota bacterium]